ncbi:MAG: FlgO family outer membrane protein [Colwellia sp.]|nr:FlgO family outer membrane protein [Colwellia sp.]
MRILIILISVSCITACSNFSGDFFESANGSESVTPKQEVSSSSKNLIHQHVTRLANTLFSSAKNIKLNQSVAVGTFLPVSLINEKSKLEQNHIGLQIQESFITLGSQAGLNIIEYKTMSSIMIQQGSDVMLSRNTQNLHEKINAQYFLTGTYSEQENSLVVNARLIELSNQNVVAAATDYIPTVSLRSKQDLSQSKQKITMKNNMLYRKSF